VIEYGIVAKHKLEVFKVGADLLETVGSRGGDEFFTQGELILKARVSTA
jgi:hypothetical protein